MQAALKIQHWFFSTRKTRRQVPKAKATSSGLKKPTVIPATKIPKVAKAITSISHASSPFAVKDSKS